MKCHKRGQGGINAAILVAIIAALIIIYILFLPTEQRDEILEIENGETGETSTEEAVLLSEHPGKLEHLDRDEVEHTIPSLNLYTKEEAAVIKQANSIYVKNAWFDKETRDLDFTLKDPTNSKNMLLTFEAKKREGRLMIDLNGNEILNTELDSATVTPIRLFPEYLENNNKLTFSTSPVGFAFWKTNEYSLENVKITGDITDITTRESESVFLVTEAEKDNIEEVELIFYPDCNVREVGPLNILINNHNIFSSVPDCGVERGIEFSPFYILEGENRLVFNADRGRYLIDQVVIKTKLKESPSYVYYFDLSDDQFNEVEDGNMDVNLTLEFVDDVDEKEADIIINGRKTRLYKTTDLIYTKDISSYVEEGTNSLKIIPEKTFDVVELRVELTE